jgi:hypothetical protein
MQVWKGFFLNVKDLIFDVVEIEECLLATVSHMYLLASSSTYICLVHNDNCSAGFSLHAHRVGNVSV